MLVLNVQKVILKILMKKNVVVQNMFFAHVIINQIA